MIIAEISSTIVVPPFAHTLGFYRASRFYIELYLGDQFSLSNPQGITGAKMIEEDNPNTSTDDHILTLFAVNSGTGQILYNVGLTNLKVYGKLGNKAGEFYQPMGITTNPRGDVYVADCGNNRIVKLKYTNRELRYLGVIYDSFNQPTDVALDYNNNLYVVDSKNSRIVVYDSLGNYLYEWRREFQEPTAIAIIDKDDPYNYWKEDFIVVIDQGHKRILKLSRSGQLLAMTDARAIGLLEAQFMYCAIDRYANIYVTDLINHEVHKFDRNLAYIISVGGASADKVTFSEPRGIFIWKRFGQVFIADNSGGAYYWLSTDGFIIGCFPNKLDSIKTQTTIALYLTDLSEVQINITDAQGNLVRNLIIDNYLPPGEALIAWDGRDNSGQFIPRGEYTINVTLLPTYPAQRRYFKKELSTKIKKV
ncbi:MAG: FlgD immunoglobulin-like domain containing protein [candidate division WOR-3 bacterium]